MSTEATFQINSSSSEDTLEIGRQLGKNCRGGELFLLSSDLGGGKTTLTKGLAEGLGSKDTVSSPTFTVSNIYECSDGLEIHHFDFYRLSEGGVVAYELAEVIDDPKVVVVVEWGDIVADGLPDKRITISLNRSAEGEDVRDVEVSYDSSYDYVLEGLGK